MIAYSEGRWKFMVLEIPEVLTAFSKKKNTQLVIIIQVLMDTTSISRARPLKLRYP